MEQWLLIGGKVASLVLGAGAGFWFARLGTNWDLRLAGPLVLSFAAFMVGSFAWGDPSSSEFQLKVWLTLGGAVLAGVALAKLLPQRAAGPPSATPALPSVEAEASGADAAGEPPHSAA